jgi:hypothetical protein
MSEQNLPGVSAAVGIAGEIVWAEGTKRDFLGGTASFMTFPERGIVVAVTSNVSFADTASMASKIADAFAAK